METIKIDQTDPSSISTAKSILLSGGVIAIPTDTVYGIACLVDNPKNIRRLYSIKKRNLLKAIPVLIGNFSQINKITSNFPKPADILSKHFWPGALTLIVKKQTNLPKELTKHETVGIRMPNYDWLRKLMNECGPLAATSANLSGDPSPATANKVMDTLGGKIDLLIDGGTCEGGIPSTVLDCSAPTVKIIREGAITAELIHNILSKSL